MTACRRLSGGVALIVFLCGTAVASAEMQSTEPPCRWPGAAELDISGLALDPNPLDASPTRHRTLPLYRELMREPLRAPCHARRLIEDARRAMASPYELLEWACGLAGIAQPRSRSSAFDERGPSLGAASDPLLASLGWIQPLAEAVGTAWPPALPDRATLPDPLRTEIARALAAMGQAHRFLERATARLPAALTAQTLRGQLVQADPSSAQDDPMDFRALLPRLDREALLAGMLDLAAATERLHRFVSTAPRLPHIAWEEDTPMGAIVVDTTGRDNAYRLAAPLLVLDVGGNDRYEFDAAPPARRISVLIDHGGNDRYAARAAGADPSSATLGYGILWDTDGDDHYEGNQFAQAAALFGVAMLIDGAGANRFIAAGHAQGYALGGIALLASGLGNDEFTAQTHAQASADPEAVAVLIDPAGDDRYTLNDTPLSRPSPQLPTHNTSMGQGAGRGIRASAADGRSASGGIGVLIDLAGSDRYSAQVFAQGAGYHEGLGMLIDGGGDDRFEAAWYAMGAAAHAAAGVLVKLGAGSDRYRATHVTSLGAAHDLSVAVFFDEGGNDRYALGDLGLGASHDDGVALFVDLAGRDRYEVGAAACRAFGVTVHGTPLAHGGTPRATGLFVDPDHADDRIAGNCPGARDRARAGSAASAQ